MSSHDQGQTKTKKWMWLLGDIAIYNPYALASAMQVVISLRGKGIHQYVDIRSLTLLGEALTEIGNVELGNDDIYTVGRKWRSALNKLGFLYPEVPPALGIQQSEIGPLDMITPNGWRLIQADSVAGMQECFLRSLAAYYIPSDFEKDCEFPMFSPLRHTLAVMLELEKTTGDSQLSFIEMAVVVQLTTGIDSPKNIVAKLLDLRERRKRATNKKQFDGQELADVSLLHDYESQTFKDYADTNFRYLKATGLVQNKGRGIALIPEKHVFIEKLVEDEKAPDSDLVFYATLCNGASLPTDNRDSALIVLDDLLSQLGKHGIKFDVTSRSLATPADIGGVRHEIEAILSARKEEDYAARQAGEWVEIAAYMDLLIHRNRKSITLENGEEIEIPQAEAPAYFEWVLWRAFLAINSHKNKPYEARRFKIDQGFLPVGTAPGNGPDLIFEFEEFVLVVEVTLTDNFRQEAAEGEPVRFHVARVVENYAGKRVFGLFIANIVDTNTAETLRIGVWYKANDSKMALQIVPVTLEQFEKLFSAGFASGKLSPKLVQEFIRDCLAVSKHDAPEWKREIERTVQEKVLHLNAM